MAYKRKRRSYRRKSYRRKTPRRYKRRYRRARRTGTKYYHFKRAASVSVVTTVTGFDFTGAGFFRLSDVFGASEFTGLFDSYKINCVVLKIIPDQTHREDGAWTNRTPSIMYNPQFHWVLDYNDNTPLNTNQLVEYQTYKTTPLTRPITIKLYPKASQPMYINAVTTGYASPKRGTWIDCSSSNVGHYAIKFAIDNMNHATGQIVNAKIRPIYYISFKGVR